MRGLVVTIIALFALFTLIRAYSDQNNERPAEEVRGAVIELR